MGEAFYFSKESKGDVWSSGIIYTITPDLDLNNATWMFDVKNEDKHTVNWKEYLTLEVAPNGLEGYLKIHASPTTKLVQQGDACYTFAFSLYAEVNGGKTNTISDFIITRC